MRWSCFQTSCSNRASGFARGQWRSEGGQLRGDGDSSVTGTRAIGFGPSNFSICLLALPPHLCHMGRLRSQNSMGSQILWDFVLMRVEVWAGGRHVASPAYPPGGVHLTDATGFCSLFQFQCSPMLTQYTCPVSLPVTREGGQGAEAERGSSCCPGSSPWRHLPFSYLFLCSPSHSNQSHFHLNFKSHFLFPPFLFHSKENFCFPPHNPTPPTLACFSHRLF